MKSESFVSVVLVASDSIEDLTGPITDLYAVLDHKYSDFEIVVVCQGPIKRRAVAGASLLERIGCVREVQLASRVKPDIAWAAGLENAIGDFVVLFEPASDPLSLVVESVELCRTGFDVVVGTAKRPRSMGYRLFRTLATLVLRLVEYELPKNATGFRCLSRRAVNSVTRTGRYHHQLYLRIQKTGFPVAVLNYDLIGPLEKTGFLGGSRSLAHLVVFNSSRPLRWMSGLGILGSLGALGFGLYSVVVHLVSENVVEGWTTTVVFMSVLFLVQFIMLAFFGEYLGRLLDERSDQADYAVVSERHSSVMVNADRVNVHVESTRSDVPKVQTGRAQ